MHALHTEVLEDKLGTEVDRRLSQGFRRIFIQLSVISPQSASGFLLLIIGDPLEPPASPGQGCGRGMHTVAVQSSVRSLYRQLAFTLGCRISVMRMDQTGRMPLLKRVVGLGEVAPRLL